MRILISNDDGVEAQGLQVLAAELSKIGSIKVVAPDRNRSGASNSLTLHRPLRVNSLANGQYSVDGTPTDCVHLAITGVFDEPFDIVVSGINEGANLGDDTLYSGTIAAATEGRFLGLPAIAVSMAGHNPEYYQTAAIITRRIVESLKNHRLPAQTILNVNVPSVPLEKIRGMEVTRLGTRHASAPTIKEHDPRGRPIYWVGPAGEEEDAGPGTDFSAIKRNCVSITPLQIDMTHYQIFDHLTSWLDGVGWNT